LHFTGTAKAVPTDSDLGATTGGIVTFLVKLDDGAGRHVEQAFALRIVQPPPAMPETPPKKSGCGCSMSSPEGRRASGSRYGIGMLGLFALVALLLRRGSRSVAAR